MEAAKVKVSETQATILVWLSKGKHGEEISELVGISTSAVYMHVQRLRDKFGASTTAGLVGIALRNGIIK